jgi:hypothetical protein
MKKIGLALSGGGHRAALYHLGVVRFLRDAGVLPQVTHITSVSGGSIFAAHLALNWARYNGSARDFDAAAAELLGYIRLDVRNRVVRRFPLCYLLRGPRRLLGFSNRKLTLTGLLEYHYSRHLFGDTSLFRLPERPELHILATNLSEGCLCSFNREGLWASRDMASILTESTPLWPRCRWLSPPPQRFPGFSRRSSLPVRMWAPMRVRLAGKHIPTAASSTIWACACFTA